MKRMTLRIFGFISCLLCVTATAQAQPQCLLSSPALHFRRALLSTAQRPECSQPCPAPGRDAAPILYHLEYQSGKERGIGVDSDAARAVDCC